MFTIVLVYCILSLFYCMICLCCSLALRDTFYTPVARYSLFVLKVPLNTKHTHTIPKVLNSAFDASTLLL